MASMANGDAVKGAGAAKQPLKSTTGKASPVEGQNRKQQQAQPKAWQGPNPITQRASAAMPNGTDKPLPRLPTTSQARSIADVQADKHMHDRTLFLIANFTGLDATLTLKNGEQYTGVFSGGSFDSASKHQYLLKMVKRTRLPNHQQVNGNVDLPEEYAGEGDDHVMAFDVQDTADLAVANAKPSSTQPTQNGTISSSFRTDTEISARERSMPRERELKPWDAGAGPSIDMSLGDPRSRSNWDQFQVNRDKFGVETDYSEETYTTVVKRDTPDYARREAEAERIAREIEGSSARNAHVAEERRRDWADEDGLDEEEKYSGVRREGEILPKRAAGAYVPPSQRPITNTPTVHGAPYDPAILSMEKPTRPTPAAAPETAADGSSASQLPATEEAKPPAADPTRQDAPPPSSSTTQQPPRNDDTMRATADAFKQFANLEKLKIRQAAEQKRMNVRHEKNVKLNDLKKFAANFKLSSRVPDDLVPILAKDSDKQREIQRKADLAAKEHELKGEEKKKDPASSVTPPAPSSAVSMAASATPDQRIPPFNPHSRTRGSQQIRGGQMVAGQGQSPRGPLSQAQRLQQNTQMFNNGRGGVPAPQPLPADLRIPTGPASAAAIERAPLSPTSATRFNVNAFEFRPSAVNFTPSGTTPSPQRSGGAVEAKKGEDASASFFGKDKKIGDPKDHEDVEAAFNPLKRMAEMEHPDEHKKSIAANGGVPQPYRTPPTWNFGQDMANVSYKDTFPKASQVPVHSQGPSPLHTPNPMNGPMPHAHQLPMHLQQQAPQMGTPNQRPQFYQQQSHGHAPPGGFDPRMAQFGPNGSVQSSPRFPPAQMAGFPGGQGMPPHELRMQMGQMPPQFVGQVQMPGMYGMSPSMGYRQPQGGPNMGMMGMNGQPHGQMPQGRPGFPQGPGSFGGAPQMGGGGQMMVPNPSQQGYMNGPGMPQQPYSPMPPHAQPVHMPHMQGSPRPPMMQHQGSHQGFPPQGMPMGQMPFAPSPGQPHPYHFHQQQRQMSSGGSGYPQVTPRMQMQQPQMQQPSPGMHAAGAQGDEGK